MAEIAVAVIIFGISIAVGLVIALIRGAFSWLGAFFHDPLGVLLATLIGAAVLGSIIGVFVHIVAYQDTAHGGWVASVRQMWQSAHGHGQIDQGSAWFDLVCMFVCPAVLLLIGLVLLIATIVNHSRERRAAALSPILDFDQMQVTIIRCKQMIEDERAHGHPSEIEARLLDDYERRLSTGTTADRYRLAQQILSDESKNA